MKFDVYCDESRPDLLGSQNPQSQFMVIGGLWLPTSKRESFKAEIHQLRERYRIGGEFKWQKVSPSRVAFYQQLVEWFQGKGDQLRFRCIAVDHSQVDLKLYHEDDQELGFYKFYYQLLHHWILDFNEYSVFVDFKSNRRRDRLHVLRRCLDYSNLSSEVHGVQAVRSEESVLIQLADVLSGMAAYRLNNRLREDSAKAQTLEHYEALIGRRIAPTCKGEQKFNVFRINLAGGW
ncbi:DUF3800 domain-containing protein [Ectothiorhodospira sp. 9100]|uniref:DUF3800 domain-containing protein n=1 Tax=unclassified Ectothiorhodospira TaxID=2684909 RepID=UPI001EE8703A|nr:DUF3800 domain-containing protein [Ectothiorhodospira sp. 9100]MCG5518327.1 DUF3800 domain-containing protein [Ectothiorhodospira sp. 9905]